MRVCELQFINPNEGEPKDVSFNGKITAILPTLNEDKLQPIEVSDSIGSYFVLLQKGEDYGIENNSVGSLIGREFNFKGFLISYSNRDKNIVIYEMSELSQQI